MNGYVPTYSVSSKIFSYATPCSIRPDTIRIFKSDDEPDLSTLELIYSTKYPVVVSVFLNVTEMENITYNLTQDFKTAENKAYEKHFLCKKGTNKKILMVIPISIEELMSLSISDKKEFIHNQRFQMVIRLEPQDYKHRFVNMYYFKVFENSESLLEVKMIKHKMEIKDQAYYIYDIYGMEKMTNKGLHADDLGQLCSICMASSIEVVILPCRHMCICLDCALLFNETNPQGKKKIKSECPICRESIASFINIKGIGRS